MDGATLEIMPSLIVPQCILQTIETTSIEHILVPRNPSRNCWDPRVFLIQRIIVQIPETDALGNDVVSQRSECRAVPDGGAVVVPHDLGRPLRLSFEDDVRFVLRYSHLLPVNPFLDVDANPVNVIRRDGVDGRLYGGEVAESSG